MIKKRTFTFKPIPVNLYNEKYCQVDGHTWAFVLYRNGFREITAYEESEDIDSHLYEHCIEWCHNKSAQTVADLDHRIISKEQYQSIWNGRCV